MQVECLVSSKYLVTVSCLYCQSHLYSSEVPYEISTVIIPILHVRTPACVSKIGI